MRTLPEARQELADIVTAAYNQAARTIITREGQPVAAAVPLEDVETLEAVETIPLEDMMDLKVAAKRLTSFREHGGTTLDAFRRELGEEHPEEK